MGPVATLTVAGVTRCGAVVPVLTTALGPGRQMLEGGIRPARLTVRVVEGEFHPTIDAETTLSLDRSHTLTLPSLIGGLPPHVVTEELGPLVPHQRGTE